MEMKLFRDSGNNRLVWFALYPFAALWQPLAKWLCVGGGFSFLFFSFFDHEIDDEVVCVCPPLLVFHSPSLSTLCVYSWFWYLSNDDAPHPPRFTRENETKRNERPWCHVDNEDYFPFLLVLALL